MKDKTKNNMSNMSSRTHFDKESATWHENIRYGDIERLHQILISKVKGIKRPLLDAGSGTGILLPVLSRINSGLFPVYEVDLSLNMLAKNRENHRNKFNANYLQANVENLPFKAQFFQTIICLASYAHFNSKDQVRGEFWRVLSPGGIIVILHLMGRDNLNKMHKRAGGAVRNDRLPAIDSLASNLELNNFSVLHKEDRDDIYLLIAQK